MRSLMVAMMLLASAGRAFGQAPASDPMAPIAWIAGDWEAEAKGPASAATTRVVNHYHAVLGGKALELETTFNGNERYRGMSGYDPARKTVGFWYLMTTGESTAGTMTGEDGYALFDFNVTSLEGKSSHLQVHIVHVDADHYRWEMYANPRGAGMSKLFEIAYKRVK
jgi:hypothetical protein